MRNIFRIFTGDIRRIRHNVIALIIVLGLLILPCMYAWFNIAASWNPYDNTGNLKVAVANLDEGYQGEMMPVELNVGDKVVSALHENDSIHWIFTSEKDAVRGTRSGKYYAALVISKDFSKDIMSLFSDKENHPVITYYSNQKVNAISPKVTDKASTALKETIGEMFMKTLSEVTVNSLSNASGFIDEARMEDVLKEMNKRLKVLKNDMDATADIVDALVNMTDTLENLCKTTEKMVDKAGDKERSDHSKLKDATSKVNNLSSDFGDISKKISSMFSDSMDIFSEVESKIGKNFGTLKTDREAVSSDLKGMAEDIQTLIDRYKDWEDDLILLQEKIEDDLGDDLEEIKKEVEDNTESDLKNTEGESGTSVEVSVEVEIEVKLRKARLAKIAAWRALQKMIQKLDQAIARQETLKSRLENADKLLSSVDSDITDAKKELQSDAAECREKLKSLKDDYNKHLQSDLGELSSLLSSAGTDSEKLRSILKKTTDDSGELLDSASDSLRDLNHLLEDTSDDIRQASGRLETLIGSLNDGVDSEDIDLLKDLIAQDGELLASLWASPVRADTHVVYEISNYGSSMTPYYTALSIWVGGIVMVSMIQTMLSKKRIRELEAYGKMTLTQQYLGRSLIFLAIGLIQSSLICLGNLYFLEIQCIHPFLFLLTGWLSSIVFVMIIYTLTISFGDIGKAVCVVLMVTQVAGSGGTFPIETAPAISKAIYPFLPFVHSMNALRECIAGMYKDTYWTEMRNIALYLIPALILGLLLRRPVIRLNHFFEEKLEEVRFM